jgi:NAD(P)-dependent dehydrogenase (short-subunit alcohol dehydrogenase family)
MPKIRCTYQQCWLYGEFYTNMNLNIYTYIFIRYNIFHNFQPTERSLTTEGNEVIMATALGGTMLLSSLLLPILKKADRPRIINVSSGGAYTVRALLNDLNTENFSKYDGTLTYVYSSKYK